MHDFQTESSEKIAAKDYSNINMRLSYHQNKITILTISNIGWAL